MLRKLTDAFPYNLLPLLAILSIAVGMPLLHPVLHSHPEHHHISADHGVEHFLAIPYEDKAHECPICDFLATSQLYDTGLGLIITENEPVGKIVSANHIFLVKTCQFQIEPRAPPVFTSL